MGTVRYTVIEGEVVSELRGGVKRDYVPDPLGSTVALLDSTQTITDTFQYWPYGESAARTGTTATPFQYVGTLGYYTDAAERNYVRARYLENRIGKWLSEDPLGIIYPDVNLTTYSSNSPVCKVDPTGYKPVFPRDPRFPKPNTWTEGYRRFCNCVNFANVLLIKRTISMSYGFEYGQFGGGSKRPPIGDINGPADAFRHCVWGCLVRRTLGKDVYNCVVLGHENDHAWFDDGGITRGATRLGQSLGIGPSVNPQWGNWRDSSSPMDLANNERGRKCSEKNMSCEACCTADLRAGNLYILPSECWIPPNTFKNVNNNPKCN